MTRKEAIEIIEGRNFSCIECIDRSEECCEALEMAILALERESIPSISENPNKWIPVSERLPEKSGFYLVSTTDCITIMEFINGWISQNIGSCNWYVKAWMPLPEPYKAESEDKE